MKISAENKSIGISTSNESLLNVELNKVKSELKNAHNIIKLLEEKIKLLNQKKFGKSSESFKSMDLELVFDDVDIIKSPEEAASFEEEVITVKSFKRKKTVGRKIDTSTLPREVCTHDLPESEKTCDSCHSPLSHIGDDVSEKIELIPAIVKVVEHVTKKYACNTCKTAISAKKPNDYLEK